MRIILLIPAYNAKPWSQVFNQKLSSACFVLKQKFGLDSHLVFVDDGSVKPETELDAHMENLRQVENCQVTVTRHGVNRGQGAALMTALKIGRDDIEGDFFVTLDSDEQHDPLNIIEMFEALQKNKFNIVFGNRFAADKFYLDQIPTFRKVLLTCAIKFERYLTGVHLSDAHNGFRVFDRKTALILDIKQDRMAHATEIKKLTHKNKLKYGEVCVQISYTGQSIRQGQNNGNAINIVQELIRERMF